VPIVAYLKPDAYVLLDYSSATGDGAINLFVAHFRSLQKTYGPHAPRICLPGSGWLETSSNLVSIAVPGRPEGIPVNQLTYEKSGARIVVLYWYQNDRNIWAQEFRAKLRLLPDLIKYRRSDVSLVRLIATLREPEPSLEVANCIEFTKLIFPSLAERFRTK
jgi:EpsI family protein